MVALPQHIAIIMDGNGRWAKERHLPRRLGHRQGVEAVRRAIRFFGNSTADFPSLAYLSLFAFSTENWKRPKEEVDQLMHLFLDALEAERDRLVKEGLRLRVIGDIRAFPDKLQQRIADVEAATSANQKLTLVICANYGGQWDMAQAARRAADDYANGAIADITAETLPMYLQTADIPNPDILIRTSGEHRISNFYLWQLAYTELFFVDKHWPDFGDDDFEAVLAAYQQRKRRFGGV